MLTCVGHARQKGQHTVPMVGLYPFNKALLFASLVA